MKTPPRPLPYPRRAGFSTLEIVVTVALLSVTMLGAVTAHVSARSLIRESAETHLAVGTLESTMEQVLLWSAADLTGGNSPYTIGQDVPAAGNGPALDDARIVLTAPGYAAGDPTPAVLEVALTLSWTSAAGHTRTITLTSAKR